MSKPDVTSNFATVVATLAIVLQVLVVLVLLLAFVSLFSTGARRLLVTLRDTFAGSELWIAFIIALAATAGSLFFSEYSSFIPCRLCWFQRIAMYPLVVILFVGAIRRDRNVVYYAITFPIAGLIVGSYHKYIEIHPEAELAGCKIGAPCSTKWIDKFGYVTIPVLAMSAFAAILTLLLFAWSSKRAQARADAEPAAPPDAGAEPEPEPLPAA
jgi:disulfide bond formation protein DsbB